MNCVRRFATVAIISPQQHVSLCASYASVFLRNRVSGYSSPGSPTSSAVEGKPGDDEAALPSSPAKASDPAEDEETKWWPPMPLTSSAYRHDKYNQQRKPRDGMLMPPVDEPPGPAPEERMKIDINEDSFFTHSHRMLTDTVFEQERKIMVPPSFDPMYDDVDEVEHIDGKVLADILAASREDQRKLTELGNPLSADEAILMLMDPTRGTPEAKRQRAEFNGFQHWGLLGVADWLIEQKEYKRAHTAVNRYIRDLDLFAHWLEHPKVKDHIKKKFDVDLTGRFDKTAALALSYYTRGRICMHDQDAPAALNCFIATQQIMNNHPRPDANRHRKLIGAYLFGKAVCYRSLKSWRQTLGDLEKAAPYLPLYRMPTYYRMLAEAKEELGQIEEAREAELKAAELQENGEIVRLGIDGVEQAFLL